MSTVWVGSGCKERIANDDTPVVIGLPDHRFIRSSTIIATLVVFDTRQGLLIHKSPIFLALQQDRTQGIADCCVKCDHKTRFGVIGFNTANYGNSGRTDDPETATTGSAEAFKWARSVGGRKRRYGGMCVVNIANHLHL